MKKKLTEMGSHKRTSCKLTDDDRNIYFKKQLIVFWSVPTIRTLKIIFPQIEAADTEGIYESADT